MVQTKQYTLFKEDESLWEIKKASSLVQISNIATLVQRKAMNAMVCVAKDILKRNPDQRIFKCDLGLIKRLCGLSNNDNKGLKEGLRALRNLSIEYNILNKDKSKQRWIFSFLAYAEINELGKGKASEFTFEFPSIILDVVKKPNMYVTLSLLVIRGLSSKHSIALYEFLKDYIKLGKISCSIEDFRKLMGIKEGQYVYSTMLRKRVLEIAVKEINEKTDIEVAYELEKHGRKLLGISFTMSQKSNQKTGLEGQAALEKKLARFGIAKKKIQYLLTHHDEQYIRANITIVEEQAKKGNIENITAYLLKAFENDYRPNETEFSKQKSLEQEEQQAEEAKIAEQLAKEKALQEQFNKWKMETVLARVEGLTSIQQEIFKNEFLQEIESNDFFSKLLQSKGFENPVIQVQWTKFLTPKLLSEKEQDIAHFENGLK